MPQSRPTRKPHRSGRATRILLIRAVIAVIGIVVMLALKPDRPTPVSYAAYFVSAWDGIQQVWGLTLPDGKAIPLTYAPHSIDHFTVSADHTRMVYVSDNQIWRQTPGQIDADPLTDVSDDLSSITLALSPDGQRLAYRNHGLWMLDLTTKHAQELLADIPDRAYSPVRFLDNDRLLVDIGLGEARTRSIYVLPTQTMQQIADASYGILELMPLEDGRYLVYSALDQSVRLDGLLLGQPAVDPREPFLLTPIMTKEFAAYQLFNAIILDAVEFAPGQIRFTGSSFVEEARLFQVFMGDYNFNTDTSVIDVSSETRGMIAKVQRLQGISRDGRYIAGFFNSSEVAKVLQGTLAVTELETRTPIELTVPSPIMHFQWADRK